MASFQLHDRKLPEPAVQGRNERAVRPSTRAGADGHFQQEVIDMVKEGVEIECAYARDTMPRGVLGLNADLFQDYLQYIANRRLIQIGLKEQYPGVENPFPWMSEMMDLRKEKNFFETRVIEYQTGGALKWDE